MIKEKMRIIAVNSDVPKFMNEDLAASVFIKNRAFYTGIMDQIKTKTSQIKATVLYISGCQENQYSYDGTFNGKFTGALKHTWNGGLFNTNYQLFHKSIKSKLPYKQTPNLMIIGDLNYDFSNEIPFTI